jgi:DNA-binding CsgD family transcriptional regulator
LRHDVHVRADDPHPVELLAPLLVLGAVVALTAAGFARGFWLANAHNGFLAVAFGAVAAWTLLRRPGQPEALLFAVVGIAEGLLFLGRQIGHTGASRVDEWWGWLGVWPLALTLALVSVAILCFPEGAFLSSGWRRVGLAILALAVVCSLVSALWPVEYDAVGLTLRHPFRVGGFDVADGAWSAVAHPAYTLFQLTWVVGITARWRTASGLLRSQLALVGLVVATTLVALLVGLVVWHSPRLGLLTTPLVPLVAGVVMDRLSLGRVIEETRASGGLSGLSPRENEVLDLMAQGLSNQAIADRLHLSIKTVEPLVSSIFVKLDLPPDSASNRRVLAVLTLLKQE